MVRKRFNSKYLTVLPLAVVTALTLAACGASNGGGGGGTAVNTSETAAEGGGKEVADVAWGLNGDIVAFDPTKAYDYATSPVIMQAFDSVLRLSPEGKLIPNLAEKWTESPRKYTYTIRKGVKFWDGNELTSEDVAFSWNRHLDPEEGSFLSAFYASVKSITAKGDEVIVELKEPDAQWKYVPTITAGTVVEKKQVEQLKQEGKKLGTPSTPLIGSGPYEFVSWKKGQSITLTRNEDYWNKERPLKIKKLEFKVIEDSDTLANALLSGEIQGTFQLDGRQVQPLKSAENLQIVRGPADNIRFLAFNTKKAPFDDAKVRQALSLAIDKEGLLQSAFGGEGKLWNSPLMEGQWVFEKGTFQKAHEELPSYELDIAKAKKLMKEANPSVTTGNIVAATPEQEQQALAIQSAGKEIGLDLSVEKVPFDRAIQMIFSEEPRQYSTILYDWGVDTIDPSNTLMIPFQSTNKTQDFTQLESKQLDKELVAQNQMQNGKERAEAIVKIQKYLVEQQPWAVLYQVNTLMVMSKSLGGYQINPLWYWDSWAAELSGN